MNPGFVLWEQKLSHYMVWNPLQAASSLLYLVLLNCSLLWLATSHLPFMLNLSTQLCSQCMNKNDSPSTIEWSWTKSTSSPLTTHPEGTLLTPLNQTSFRYLRVFKSHDWRSLLGDFCKQNFLINQIWCSSASRDLKHFFLFLWGTIVDIFRWVSRGRRICFCLLERAEGCGRCSWRAHLHPRLYVRRTPWNPTSSLKSSQKADFINVLLLSKTSLL